MITNYETLPINKYNEILAICEKEQTIHERNLSLLSVLSDMDEDSLLDLPIADFNDLMKQAGFLAEPIPPMKAKRVASSYQVGEFILCPMLDVTKWKAGQYIDFQTFSKSENIVGMLSTILVPKGKTYNNDYDVAEVVKAIGDDLAITDAHVLSAFFLRRCTTLIKGMLIYSGWMTRTIKNRQERKVMKARIKEAKKMVDSLQSGVGYGTLIRSPKL